MRLARLFRISLAASLTVCALTFFLFSWRWPLVGDASLMHYIGFLIERGWAPYRDMGDMNMPGSYLIELAAMHLFGIGDLAWRFFDFSLLAITSASFFVITGRNRSLAAFFAASLFILVHGRDGLAEGGQRDLIMAVCLIAATAFLFTAVRKRIVWPIAIFGLLSGIAFAIKPTVLPLSLAQVLLAAFALQPLGSETKRTSPLRYLIAASLGFLTVLAIVLTFLIRHQALTAFLAGLHTIVPYYASLGHRPLGFILLHSISPLLPLVLIWLALLFIDRNLRNLSRDWERSALLAGVLFGLINCILQARALPYYRYPLLAFLLPLMALDFTRACKFTSSTSEPGALLVKGSSQVGSALALIALILGGFFLAPQSAVLIHRYRWWENDLITSLTENLNTLGGTRLSGHILCIDTNSGCGNVLYRMRLEPANGMLSDFLIFGSDQAPAVQQTREQFSTAIHAKPPQVMVVTSYLYLTDLTDFRKLDRWPEFESFLRDNYDLQTQWSPTRTARWWSREETPASYRIYVFRTPPGSPSVTK